MVWLNAQAGRADAPVYTLPTEAQWEYAARAGATTAFGFGDDPAEGAPFAWLGRQVDAPQPVGGRRPNAFGLVDTHGNVWEWTRDCWNDDLRGAPGVAETPRGGDCDRAPIRGGSVRSDAWAARAGERNWANRAERSLLPGFRVVATPAAAAQ